MTTGMHGCHYAMPNVIYATCPADVHGWTVKRCEGCPNAEKAAPDGPIEDEYGIGLCWWEGGEARNHEAEVEAAIGRVLVIFAGEARLNEPTIDYGKWTRAILDALRRSPQGHAEKYVYDPTCPECRAGRSPQGEDHEAGIEAALRGWEAAEAAGHTRTEVLLRRAIQDYLSRCPSPEREVQVLGVDAETRAGLGPLPHHIVDHGRDFTVYVHVAPSSTTKENG